MTDLKCNTGNKLHIRVHVVSCGSCRVLSEAYCALALVFDCLALYFYFVIQCDSVSTFQFTLNSLYRIVSWRVLLWAEWLLSKLQQNRPRNRSSRSSDSWVEL